MSLIKVLNNIGVNKRNVLDRARTLQWVSSSSVVFTNQNQIRYEKGIDAWLSGCAHVRTDNGHYNGQIENTTHIYVENDKNSGLEKFVGDVSSVEYVNEGSYRIWFTIDAWHTQMLYVEPDISGYITRTHVKEDWDGDVPKRENLYVSEPTPAYATQIYLHESANTQFKALMHYGILLFATQPIADTSPNSQSYSVYDAYQQGIINVTGSTSKAAINSAFAGSRVRYMNGIPCIEDGGASGVGGFALARWIRLDRPYTAEAIPDDNGTYYNMISGTIYVPTTSDTGNAHYINSPWQSGTYEPLYTYNYGENLDTLWQTIKYLGDDILAEAVQKIMWAPQELFTDNTHTRHNFQGIDTNPLNRTTLEAQVGNKIHNAKCLSYPYCQGVIQMPNGNKHIFKWEDYYRGAQQVHISLIGTGGSNATLAVFPNLPNQADQNYMENTVYFSDFPTFNLIIDAQAQILKQAIGNIGSASGDIIGSFLEGKDEKAIGKAIGTVAGTVTQMLVGVDKLGLDSSNQLQMATDNLYPILYSYHADQNGMKAIDDFFSMYGYAVNRIAQFEYRARSVFSYLSVDNATFGNTLKLPARLHSEIVQQLANGVTIWYDSAEIGRYTEGVLLRNEG